MEFLKKKREKNALVQIKLFYLNKPQSNKLYKEYTNLKKKKAIQKKGFLFFLQTKAMVKRRCQKCTM